MPGSRRMPVITFLLLTFAQYIRGHSTGLGISSACDTFTPGHGLPVQTSPSPFKISFTPSTYAPGDVIAVTLSSCSGTGFKGFLIQARRAENLRDQSESLGLFGVVSNTRQTCTGNRGLAHTEGSVKSSKTFNWFPPNTAQGHIVFRVTFVRDYSTYWVDVTSEVLLDASINAPLDPTSVSRPTTLDTNCPTSGVVTAAPTTQKVTTTTTTQKAAATSKPTTVPTNTGSGNVLANGNFITDPACGSTKTCFSNCDPTTGCTYQVAWRDVGDSGEYTLTTKSIAPSNIWVAIGFSADTNMGDDSVTGCRYFSTGNVDVFNAKNGARRTPPTMLTPEGITLVSSNYANGIFSCTFRRLKAAGLNGDRFALTQDWYLLYAQGLLSGTSLSYHQASNRFISSARYSGLTPDPNAVNPATTGAPITNAPRTTTPAFTGSVVKDTACGDTKGCFSDCQGTTCSYEVSWQEDGNDGLYTLKADVASDTSSWIALGFSSDDEMGGDGIMGCASLSDGSVVVFNGVTTGEVPPTLHDDNEVTIVSSVNEDGILSCTIRRPKAASTDGKRRDISLPWTFLFAKGLTSGSSGTVSPQYHGVNKFVSSEAFTVSDTIDSAAKALKFPLVKVHGALMIGAWIFFASVGVIAARYYKPVWKGMACSQKVWFQIHRTCMVLVFCTTVAGFVVIFVEVDGWSELIESKEHLETHPILGVITTSLAVFNPLMALFRPHPGTPNRPFFNWAHWFVGTSAHVMGVITIFFGVQLTKADAPDYLVYILAGYVAWQVFVSLVLEIITCYGRRRDRKEIYEMSGGSGPKVDLSTESDGTSSVKRVIFFLHCFIVAALSGVVIALVAVGEEELEH